jgi:hypothetical protein
MRKLLILIALSLMLGGLFAQAPAPAAVASPAISDSLAEQKKLEILDEYGIRETSTLQETAKILELENMQRFKHLLNLEESNDKLDSRTLRQLGITPYEAFLASQKINYGFSELNNLTEVAAVLHIPIKKLKSMLGEPIDPLTKEHDLRSLQSLNLSPERLMEIKDEFEQDRVPYGFSLTLVGMLVVFSALLITSIVIGQLRHLQAEKKKEPPVIKVSATGKVIKAPSGVSSDIIVAAVSALYIYEYTIKERRRIQLTFNRSKTNQWRSSAILSMPNREFTRKRS